MPFEIQFFVERYWFSVSLTLCPCALSCFDMFWTLQLYALSPRGSETLRMFILYFTMELRRKIGAPFDRYV